jgi:hypothetical protein
MKKLVLLFVTVIFTLALSAQNGKVQSITPDTLTAVETEYFVIGPVGTSWDNLTIQALHTQLGGTSDGTGVLQASVDGVSYLTIQDQAGILKGYPNDSVTITNGAVYQWVVSDVPFNYFRYASTGTANDTTLVTVKYIFKK